MGSASVLSGSDLLVYVGIGLMATAVVLAAISTVIFIVSGRRLSKKLEQEYGEKWQTE